MSFKRMNNRDNQLILAKGGTPTVQNVRSIYPQKDYSLKGIIHLSGTKREVTLPTLNATIWDLVPLSA